jgi:hypothetical protein
MVCAIPAPYLPGRAPYPGMGNGRYGDCRISALRSNIPKCKHFFQMFGLSILGPQGPYMDIRVLGSRVGSISLGVVFPILTSVSLRFGGPSNQVQADLSFNLPLELLNTIEYDLENRLLRFGDFAKLFASRWRPTSSSADQITSLVCLEMYVVILDAFS